MGPAAWVEAAITALAEAGEAGVAVEPLARRLGVTKGSFYWHFADRDALWTALLGAWEEQGTAAPIALLAPLPPRERLRRLFAIAWDTPEHLRAQRALLASSRPDVREAVARVHARRRGFLEQAYRDLGLPDEQAALHATAAYATFVGGLMLSDQPPFTGAAGLEAFAEHLGRTLIPG